MPVDVLPGELEVEREGEWEIVTADGHHLRGSGSLAPDLAAALVASLVRSR